MSAVTGAKFDKPQRATFNWEDPFDLDGQLSEDERMIRDAAHAFAQDVLAPRVAEDFMEEKAAPELFLLMGAQDLLGVTVPEEYGGVGASYVINRRAKQGLTQFRCRYGGI